MTLTDRVSVVTQALVNLLRTNWDNIAATKDDIFYGDQSRYARFPSIAVESAPQDRSLTQTGLQQRITFGMFIMVYHGGLKNGEVRKKEADETAELVIGILHGDRRLSGLLIHSNVTNNEPGFASRGGQLLVVNRLSWEGLSNHTMPRD